MTGGGGEEMLDDVSETHYVNPVSGFTKLFSSLIFSTVWREEMPVKIVWITMLAMANRNGEVLASVPGLADAARVSLPQCRHALKRLASPDPDSRTKDHQGRRIIEVDGGWRLLNYPTYRELRDADERRMQTREAVRAFRERKAKGVTVSKVSRRKPRKAQAEAEAEAEIKPSTPEAWVRVLGQAWINVYGGIPNYGQIGSNLKPLLDTHPFEVVQERWGHYLESTEARYASPTRFAQTFGSWDRPGGAPPQEGRVSTDEARLAFRAAGIPDTWPVNPDGYQSRVELQVAIDARVTKLAEAV